MTGTYENGIYREGDVRRGDAVGELVPAVATRWRCDAVHFCADAYLTQCLMLKNDL